MGGGGGKRETVTEFGVHTFMCLYLLLDEWGEAM